MINRFGFLVQRVVLVGSLLGLLGATACSGGGQGGVSSSSSGNSEPKDAGGAPASNDGDGGNGPLADKVLSSITIEPALVELTSTDGSQETADFTVTGTYNDRSQVKLSGATFSLDSRVIGTVGEASGHFVASGIAGGIAKVTAKLTLNDGTELTSEGAITVHIKRALTAGALPPDAETHFQGTAVDDAAHGASLVYPLDHAVMPQNVFPADLQWLRGTQGDLFRIRMSKPHVEVSVLLQHVGAGFGNHYLVDLPAWRSLVQTDPDVEAEIAVDRWEAQSDTLYSSSPVHVRFARAALTGSIYYWDIEKGRIRRIDDGTNVAVDFMPTPQEGCVGCHAVSPSGRYMAGRLGGGVNIGAVFDLTSDLSVAKPPTTFTVSQNPLSAQWWFATWSPDEKRLAVTYEGGSGTRPLTFFDPFKGSFVVGKGTFPTNATQPAWSPDGTQIAYVANANSWGDWSTTGDIALLPVVGPDTVGTSSVVHAGSDLKSSTPQGVADSYPTWSPDSRLIAFAHGTGTRSDTQEAALYLMNRDGTGVVRLDRASGGTETKDNYQPRFSPFETQDYFWLSFLSRRDYGNAEVGTLGASRQQIWVTAIKKNPGPNEDPSEVGYWVSGQDPKSKNISAYWAARACRTDGESCSVGSECCGGQCLPDATGALVCSPPPPQECHMQNQTCTNDSDCCEGLECSDHVCSFPLK